MTSFETFDTTVAQTNTWLRQIMDEMEIADRHRAYQALRAVLIALRDRLPPSEVADLAAQLPVLVRGIFFETWDPNKAEKIRTRDEFLARVRDLIPPNIDIDIDKACHAVMATLRRNVSPEELEEVRNVLPKKLKTLLGERLT